MGDQEKFDEEFLKRLEYLYIMSKKIVAGANWAERKTRIVGSGLEFADFRNYSAGDDLRNIDWKLFARTEKLFLKLYEEEEDLFIYFLVDTSRSMFIGNPTKFSYVRRVVAALSYIGLSNFDRVSIIPFSDALTGRLPPARGKGQIFKVFEFLNGVEAAKATNLKDAFKTFVAQNKRRGIVVVLSDFYDPSGFEEGLNMLRYHKFEPMVVHVFDQRELDPNILGDVQLVDCESGAVTDVTVTPALKKAYAKAFDAMSESLQEYCTKRQILYFRAPIQLPYDELIMGVFRAGGFLK